MTVRVFFRRFHYRVRKYLACTIAVVYYLRVIYDIR